MTRITDTKYELGLADVQREGGPGEGLAEQVPAQERGGAAGAGDDLQDLAQDLLLHLRQRVGDRGGDLGMAGGGAGQADRDRGASVRGIGSRRGPGGEGVLGAGGPAAAVTSWFGDAAWVRSW